MSNENASLLPSMAKTSVSRKPKRGVYAVIARSKAANLVLLWNISVFLAYKGFYDTNAYIQVTSTFQGPILANSMLTIVAVFAPFAGLLTDVKFSRHKAVLCNSHVIVVKLIAVLVLLLVLYLVNFDTINIALGRYILYSGMVISSIVYIVFMINALLFGMNQLRDLPTEDSILFIHWYVMTYYVGSLVAETIWNLMFYNSMKLKSVSLNHWPEEMAGICIAILTFITIFTLKVISLFAIHKRKVWFFFEPAKLNPCKLVYKVMKFVYHHKVPLRRSAFTYNDEEMPSRMDVGKHKYGGPFTTKEVEDVKAFWGILKIIILVGPAFLLQAVTQSVLPLYTKHGNNFVANETIGGSPHFHPIHQEGTMRYIILSNGLLSPLLVVLCIPLYLCCIRPHFTRYIPSMLKRITVSVLIILLSLLCFFFMDFVIHFKDNNGFVKCMFDGFNKDIHVRPEDLPEPALYQNVYFLIVQHILSALANMFLDTAILEFVCSQSPHSMKGLLFGILFSVRSFFQGVAITLIIPFAFWSPKIKWLSCGSGFYLVTVLVALTELVVIGCVAKRHEHRNNDNEPCNEYRYAEEYYSNIR